MSCEKTTMNCHIFLFYSYSSAVVFSTIVIHLSIKADDEA